MDLVHGGVIFDDSLSITTEKNKNKRIKIYLRLRNKVKVRFTRRNGESGRRILLTNFNERKVDYKLRQPNLNLKDRDHLVEWLLEAHLLFCLDDLTAFTTVDILDRFLLDQGVSSSQELHYIGVVAMHIATKYCEKRSYKTQSLDQLVHAVNGGLPDPHAHNRYRARIMEQRILNRLGWELEVPTVYTFLTQFLNAAENPPDATMEKMAYFYAKLGIWDHELVIDFPPSVLAAAALRAACVFTCNISMWRKTYRDYTGIKCTQLFKCSKRMLEVHSVTYDMECDWWIPFK